MNWISMLIKPASGNCNMRCKYCFYRDVTENREVENYGMMSEDTIENIVRKAFDEAAYGVSFAFQGGEPTLRGLAFYRHFAELVNQYNKRNIAVEKSIQTNGILIDDEWCAFLKENNFLVGISLDGLKPWHDEIRVDAAREGTFDRVMNTVNLLKKYGVDFNILTVVTNLIAGKGAKLYSFFKNNGLSYIQFIPSIADFGTVQSNEPCSLSPEKYGAFLKTVFDCWFRDLQNGTYISINNFDNWVGMFLGREPTMCAMSGKCNAYACIEANGNVYPCDFYVLDEHNLGNINDASFNTILTSSRAGEFEAQSTVLPDKCRSCKYAGLCRNGCRRSRQQDGLNVFCNAYYDFFEYAFQRLREAAKMAAEGRIPDVK